jgi:hypothetical protein
MFENIALVGGLVGIGMLILSVLGSYLGVSKIMRDGLDKTRDDLSGKMEKLQTGINARMDALAEQVAELRADVIQIKAEMVTETECRARHESTPLLRVAK